MVSHNSTTEIPGRISSFWKDGSTWLRKQVARGRPLPIWAATVAPAEVPTMESAPVTSRPASAIP